MARKTTSGKKPAPKAPEAPPRSRDTVVIGDVDQWQLMGVASSQRDAWRKSTKAMPVPGGALVQVSSEIRDKNGNVALAEALAFVPSVRVVAGKLVK